MKVDELLSTFRDAVTVRRVYGDPYERDGVTVIPAAAVSGGSGGGQGTSHDGDDGQGGGIGVRARPVGAYVLADGKLRWEPAVDVTRIVGMLGAVAIVYLLTSARVRRARLRAARVEAKAAAATALGTAKLEAAHR